MIDMVEGSRGLPEHQVRRYIIQVLVALQVKISSIFHLMSQQV
jgi:hypothetical protein